MTIKIALLQLQSGIKTLHELAVEKIPFKASFQIGRIIRKTHGDLEDFNKKRDALILEYGVKDEESGQIEVKPGQEKFAEFMAKYQEMAEVEIDIDAKPLHVDLMDGLPIEAERLINCLWAFSDD